MMWLQLANSGQGAVISTAPDQRSIGWQKGHPKEWGLTK